MLISFNNAIVEFDARSTGIEMRTLRKDIQFMRSESGYNAPIETLRGSNGNYYRYSDRSFSINKSPLNETEAEQLKKAISILQRFEGSPEFEWVNQLGPLLNDKFGLQNQEKKVMSLESNIDYKGYDYITPLFNAIINKTVLKVKYEPFGKDSYDIIFHPYFLKQYNNRWFVFGLNEFNHNPQWNLALDRITDDIEVTKTRYVEDLTDWDEFFEEMIGVSKNVDCKPVEVKLLLSKDQAPYIQTKPFHSTQKVSVLKDGSLEIRISVILNYELEMKILSFGEKVKVITPEQLVTKIKERTAAQLNNY